MLYLFLHGLTVLRDVPGGIEIILPQVNGHVYKAGNWLAETPIASSQLTLANVVGGNASVSQTAFMINVPRQYPVTPNGRIATISAPSPIEVLGLSLAVDRANHVAIWNRPPGPPTPPSYDSLAEVVVLVYDYSEETGILLNNHYWEPYSVGSGISLHIISTSEVAEGKQHQIDTAAALELVFGASFPGVTYTIKPPRPIPAPWMDTKSLNFGDIKGRQEREGCLYEPNGNLAFALAELEHPATRAQRLERLGRMHRANRRIDNLWRRPEPLNAGCGPCGSVSGN